MLEAHLKVSTVPARMRAPCCSGRTASAAALRRLLEVRGPAAAPGGARGARRGAAGGPARPRCPSCPPPAAVAIVGIEGSEASLERHRRDLGHLRARRPRPALLEGGAARAAVAGVPGRARAGRRRGHGARGRAAARPAGAAEPACEPDAAGAHRPSSATPAPGIAPAAAAARSRSWRARTRASPRGARAGRRAVQGYVVVESAPLGIAGREHAALGERTSHSSRGRSIKDAWDPTAILNPGRQTL